MPPASPFADMYHEMNDKRSNERGLRLLSVLMWPFGFGLCLASSIVEGHALPAVGIAPLTFSTLGAMIVLSLKRPSHRMTFFWDLLCAIFFFAVLIPCWVHFGHPRWNSRINVLLAAYGTVPMMVNFIVHLWLIGKHVISVFPSLPAFLRGRCAECHREYVLTLDEQNNGYASVHAQETGTVGAHAASSGKRDGESSPHHEPINMTMDSTAPSPLNGQEGGWNPSRTSGDDYDENSRLV